MNRHVHTEYLKLIEVYSPLGIWHVFSIYQYLPLPVYEVPAIRENTTKSTYTFTSVIATLGLERTQSNNSSAYNAIAVHWNHADADMLS